MVSVLVGIDHRPTDHGDIVGWYRHDEILLPETFQMDRAAGRGIDKSLMKLLFHAAVRSAFGFSNV
jgi:hypothetical protein